MLSLGRAHSMLIIMLFKGAIHSIPKIQESEQKKALLPCKISTEIKQVKNSAFQGWLVEPTKTFGYLLPRLEIFFLIVLSNCVFFNKSLTEVSTSGTKC